jgi:hypothetical protein
LTGIAWEHEAEARAALSAIVSDPEYGEAALGSAQTLSNLLKDLLPDAPREKRILVAAAEAGLAESLREHVAQGMDPGTAIRLSASSLQNSAPFPPEACTWVAGELANAMGISQPAGPPGGTPGATPQGYDVLGGVSTQIPAPGAGSASGGSGLPCAALGQPGPVLAPGQPGPVRVPGQPGPVRVPGQANKAPGPGSASANQPPNYQAPGYQQAGYRAPGYRAPGSLAPGSQAAGYQTGGRRNAQDRNPIFPPPPSNARYGPGGAPPAGAGMVGAPPAGAGVPGPGQAYTAAGAAYTPPRNNPLAITSLVCGCAQFPLWFAILIPGFLAAIAALIFGIIAVRQVRAREEGGFGMAVAGICLGGLGALGGVAWIAIFGYAASHHSH